MMFFHVPRPNLCGPYYIVLSYCISVHFYGYCIAIILHRPVKVIRLVNQHSVEEIILNRASSKMRLTSAVIAVGQVS